MNIRSLSNPGQIQAAEVVETKRKQLDTDQTTDRDGNGQQAFGDGSGERDLTQAELENVVEKLKKNKGIVSSDLDVVLCFEGKIPFVEVRDQSGNVVKRINKNMLFQYLSQSAEEPLSLVHKVA